MTILRSYSQINAVKSLSISDTVPDISFNNIINYSSPSAKLSDFKGKIVILDFWATWCSACTKAIPRNDTLQAAFQDQVQFLLVDSDRLFDKPERVNRFLSKWEDLHGKQFPFPITIADTVLAAFFPHRLLPHYVWLDSGRRVVAITGSAEITEDNIRQVLAGNNHLPVKHDLQDFRSSKPLLVDGNGGTPDHFSFRSLITNHIPGAGTISGTQVTENSTRLFAINCRLLDIYGLLYQDHFPRGLHNRVILQVKDSTLFFPPTSVPGTVWNTANTWCYELILPAGRDIATGRQIMQNDLNGYFGLKSRIEMRKMPCLVLTRDKHTIPPLTKGNEPAFEWNGNSMRFCNQPVWLLVEKLTTIQPLPVLDETGINGNIDLELYAGSQDLEGLTAELRRHGLVMARKRRWLSILVISNDLH